MTKEAIRDAILAQAKSAAIAGVWRSDPDVDRLLRNHPGTGVFLQLAWRRVEYAPNLPMAGVSQGQRWAWDVIFLIPTAVDASAEDAAFEVFEALKAVLVPTAGFSPDSDTCGPLELEEEVFEGVASGASTTGRVYRASYGHDRWEG